MCPNPDIVDCFSPDLNAGEADHSVRDTWTNWLRIGARSRRTETGREFFFRFRRAFRSADVGEVSEKVSAPVCRTVRPSTLPSTAASSLRCRHRPRRRNRRTASSEADAPPPWEQASRKESAN
jgi:hypothetical protein